MLQSTSRKGKKEETREHTGEEQPAGKEKKHLRKKPERGFSRTRRRKANGLSY